MTRTKQQARAVYDRLSRWYDWLAGPAERRYREAGLRLLHASEGEKVLEIGFGTGKALLELARAVGPEGQVHGVDISEGMRRLTERRLERAGLAGRVLVTRADATALALADGGLDAAFASFTLETFDTPEIPVVLGECRRVLRVGGRIVVVGLSRDVPGRGEAGGLRSPCPLPLPLRLYEWAHRAFPALVDCRPIHIRSSLEEAGFIVETVTTGRMWGLPVEAVLARKEA